MNKSGEVSVPLVLGVIICSALLIIVGVYVFKLIIISATFGTNEIAIKDIAIMIDTAYAAPENLEAIYNVPTGADGYPAIGTLALANGYEKDGRDVSEVCISNYRENEMWMYILNSALPAWIGSSVINVDVTAYRSKQLAQGINYWKKPVVDQFINFEEIYRTGDYATLNEGTAAYQKALTKFKANKLTPTQKLGKWVLRGVEGGSNKLIEKLTLGASKKAVTRTKNKVIEKVSAAIARYSAGAAAVVGPEATLFGRPIAYIISSSVFIMDYLWTTAPFIAAIHVGYAASEKMQKSISCYEFTRTDERIRADPPNCNVEIDGGLVRSSTCGNSPAKIKGQDYSYGSTTHLEGTCSDCPNYFISMHESGESNLDLEKYGADTIMIGTRAICLATTLVSPTAGMACGAAWYGGFFAAYEAFPGTFMSVFTGANILPRDKYYYMEFPVDVGISKVYNASTGTNQAGSYLHIEKNKEEVVV